MLDCTLSNVKVVDLTQAIAGPVCTQLLGGLGADIIKVEPPDGEPFRDLYDGAHFAAVNLGGKRSICIDMATKEGQKTLYDLLEGADVFIENFRPDVKHRLGVDYETLSEKNEDLVYCSISGFGQEGPYSHFPGIDPVIQAISGIMDATGYPERLPVRVGTPVIDYTTGMMAACLVVSALHNRSQTGEGEYIDVSLFDNAVFLMSQWIAHYSRTGQRPQRVGAGTNGLAPYGLFETSDGHLFLGVLNNKVFERLCVTIDRDELCSDERFATKDARWQHRDELRDELETELDDHQCQDLARVLAEAGIPAARLQDIGELVDGDPHAAERDVLVNSHNVKTDEPVKVATLPFLTKEGRPQLGNNRPPQSGEHTRAVLSEFGYTDAEIDGLVDDYVVFETK